LSTHTLSLHHALPIFCPAEEVPSSDDDGDFHLSGCCRDLFCGRTYGSGSTPMEPPPKTSPESFNSTRRRERLSCRELLGPSWSPPGTLMAGVSDTVRLLLVLLGREGIEKG